MAPPAVEEHDASLSPTWQQETSHLQKTLSFQLSAAASTTRKDIADIAQGKNLKRREHRAHTASDLTNVGHKSEWGEAIVAQQVTMSGVVKSRRSLNDSFARKPVQRSFSALREAAERYETAATKHQWAEVFEKDARVAELQDFADGRSTDEAKGRFQPGLNKFGSVARDYSKLLDVTMNQAPVHAATAWAAMKLLLAVHTNHVRFRDKIRDALIFIRGKAALVNHFVFHNPTEKMAKAVGLLYVAFTRFLEKVIDYDRKSKVGRSLGFLVFCVEC